MIRIKLLDYTPKEILIKTLSVPYDSKNLTTKHITKIWNMKHRSFARMGIATFEIKNISQSALRQISRHPHLNLQVKSSRYCDMRNVEVYIPDKMINKRTFGEVKLSEYMSDMDKIMNIYSKWKAYEEDTGVKELDIAKQFLPLASTTDLIISANYQAWYEFLELRNCVRTEKELRKISLIITKELSKVLPEIFSGLDCRAKETNICNEFKPCGKYPSKKSDRN